MVAIPEKNLNPIRSFTRTIGFLSIGRLKFPKDRVGQTYELDGETWIIFHQAVLKPDPEQPDQPGAIFQPHHFDHIDRQFFRSLSERTPVLEPKQTVWLTRLQGAQKVRGIKAWESRRWGDVEITAVPAIHLTPTVGFVLQSEGKQIYFAGDTFYGGFMKEIGKRFQLDTALMPVTTFRLPMTLGESGAVRAVQALQPKTAIPIHLGIQPRLPLLRTGQSPEGFAQRLGEVMPETQVVVLNEGETWSC